MLGDERVLFQTGDVYVTFPYFSLLLDYVLAQVAHAKEYIVHINPIHLVYFHYITGTCILTVLVYISECRVLFAMTIYVNFILF